MEYYYCHRLGLVKLIKLMLVDTGIPEVTWEWSFDLGTVTTMIR